jgi:hypothetical protein
MTGDSVALCVTMASIVAYVSLSGVEMAALALGPRALAVSSAVGSPKSARAKSASECPYSY